jgi:hypothetical protein
MGHGFGLPHSSGPYTATYDSDWDVMSGGGICTPPDATYGCLGVHTISYHKDLLGVVPPARKYIATPGSSQTIVVERLGQPLFSGNYLMAQIPIGGSATQFYTVEARRFVGYDNQIPAEAVVIHKVDTTRSDRVARVVDSDSNGNPNDAGAMWTPGETFTDPTNGITVTVNAVTTGGFSVTLGHIGAGTAAIVSAIAPVSRSVQVGTTATSYALALNYGTATALGCSISPVSSLPAAFFFQALSCATFLPFATLNTPVDIPANGSGCFIFGLTSSSPIAPTNVTFNFDCTNSDPAPVTPEVNTLLFSASATPTPDLIAQPVTSTGGGIVDIPGPTGTGYIAVATTNVGTGGTITVEANTGNANLPVTLTICQTNPSTAACINPLTAGPSATMTIAAGEQDAFLVTVKGSGTIPFDPANNRIVINFHEGSTINSPVRGRTSVAVRTQ